MEAKNGTHSTNRSRSRLAARTWLIAAGLVVAVAVVFGASLGFDFLNWDDPQQVLGNPLVNSPSRVFLDAWRQPYWGLYIPVSYNFLACEAALAWRTDPVSGQSLLQPWVFHAGNLLLHAANTVLVFLLLRRLLLNVSGTLRVPSAENVDIVVCGSDDRADGTRSVPDTLAAALGAALFAMHPSQIESVAWISEVRGLLCGLFGLLALWQYVEYADSRRSLQGRIVLYCGASAALVLALLSKPAAVALPLMAAVLGVGLVRRRPAAVAVEMLPWLAAAAAVALKTKQLQPGALLEPPSFLAGPLIALDAIGFYLYKLFVPLQLSTDYGRTPQYVLSGRSFQLGWIILPVVIASLAWFKPRCMPLVCFALFLAWLTPVLGLVTFDYQRISTVGDRYAYLAMLGPALLSAWLLARYWNARTVAAAAVVCAGLAALSFFQLDVWRNTSGLFAHALEVNPRSAVARFHLGYAAFLKGDYKEAIDWYQESLKFGPDHLETHLALANALDMSGRSQEARDVLHTAPARSRDDEQTVREALQAVESKPEINAGQADETAGHIADARRHYLAALRIDPHNATAHYNLGNLAFAARDWQEAAAHYRSALETRPDYAQAHANLSFVLVQLGEADDAIAQARAALTISPKLLAAEMALGQALLRKGENKEAAAAFERALFLVAPDSAEEGEIEKWLRKAGRP